MLEQKNTRKQGDVGLGAAIALFTREGVTVCLPLTDNQRYDLVVDTNDGLQKVSIKTSRQEVRPGVFRVELKTSGGNRKIAYETKFSPTDADLLYVLCEDGKEFLIPTASIKAGTGIHVGGRDWNEFRKDNPMVGDGTALERQRALK